MPCQNDMISSLMFYIFNLQSNWFGGNSRPVGECGCNYGFEWDDDDLGRDHLLKSLAC